MIDPEPLRWNTIPGLSYEQNMMMDTLAHGTVTKEIVDWVCELAAFWSEKHAETKH